MDATTLSSSVESLLNRFNTLGAAFALNPSADMMATVEEAYREFYVAFCESANGLERAVEDLRAKMMSAVGA